MALTVLQAAPFKKSGKLKSKPAKRGTTMAAKKKATKKGKGSYNSRLDESLGARNGKKSQSMTARRHESEGMEKKMGRPKYSGNKSSRQGAKKKK